MFLSLPSVPVWVQITKGLNKRVNMVNKENTQENRLTRKMKPLFSATTADGFSHMRDRSLIRQISEYMFNGSEDEHEIQP